MVNQSADEDSFYRKERRRLHEKKLSSSVGGCVALHDVSGRDSLLWKEMQTVQKRDAVIT